MSQVSLEMIPDILRDKECLVIPSNISAVYRMTVTLTDGKPSHENVMLLKQVLTVFSAFHEEIRGILMEMSANG